MTTYKGYKIEVTETSAMIYKDGNLVGCTFTDESKGNQLEKAKQRIDTNRLNNIK